MIVQSKEQMSSNLRAFERGLPVGRLQVEDGLLVAERARGLDLFDAAVGDTRERKEKRKRVSATDRPRASPPRHNI